MPNKIEPALSAEEWDTTTGRSIDYRIESASGAGEWEKVMAWANHELDDNDPRKITRETVRTILAGRTSFPLGSATHRDTIQIAAALASYLQPDQVPEELEWAYMAYLPPEGPLAISRAHREWPPTVPARGLDLCIQGIDGVARVSEFGGLFKCVAPDGSATYSRDGKAWSDEPPEKADV